MTDDALAALMCDYSSPVADDGFTALVLEKANLKFTRLSKLRGRVINAAFFVGGAAAAIQLPKLAELLKGTYSAARSNFSGVPLRSSQGLVTEMIGTAPPYIWIAVIGIAAVLLWSIIDGDSLRL